MSENKDGYQTTGNEFADNMYSMGNKIATRKKPDSVSLQDTPSLPKQEGEIEKLRGLFQEVLVRMGLEFPTHEDFADLFDKGVKGEHGLFIEIHKSLFDDVKGLSEPKAFALRPQDSPPSKPYSATRAARKFERLIPGAFGLPELPAREEQEGESAGLSPEKLAEHMQNIKFLMAYYGGKKTYIECMPHDKGAFNIPTTNQWLQEFNVKPGANWQIRRFQFVIQDKLRTIGLSIDTLKPFIKWLWAYKSTKDE
jgi:hypothetical protein